MPFHLEKFKAEYNQWIATYRSDFETGRVDQALRSYPMVMSEDVPWTPFRGDPSDKTFALVCSGGLYVKDRQAPFVTGTINGDSSFREIPRTVRYEDLAIAHGHYDTRLAEKDLNTIFPLHPFIELEKKGVIGKLADSHYSFSYVNDAAALVEETAPKVLDRLRAEAVDALFMVPV
jgi:hypothetical protein